jgi:hypothetical protein
VIFSLVFVPISVKQKCQKSKYLEPIWPQRNLTRCQLAKPMIFQQCPIRNSTTGRLGKKLVFLAASTECSAGSNDHFVVGGGGGVPSLVANFQY